VVIVDDDAAWYKNVVEEEESEAEVEEAADAPQVIEDVEVKRMHKMEMLKQHRPYMSVANDGSGWVVVSGDADEEEQEKEEEDSSLPSNRNALEFSPRSRSHQPSSVGNDGHSPDSSPPRRRRNSSDLSPGTRHLTSPPPPRRNGRSDDLSPPRKEARNPKSASSPPRRNEEQSRDFSPSKRSGRSGDTLSLPRRQSQSDQDLSPPRRNVQKQDLSPLRRSSVWSPDLSPPRRRKAQDQDLSPPRRSNVRSPDFSPPRRKKAQDLSPPPARNVSGEDLSPPRRKAQSHEDLSPLRRHVHSGDFANPKKRARSPDLSPPRRTQSRGLSPPRSKAQNQDSSSPPQRKLHVRQSQDLSPPRRKVQQSQDLSPPRRDVYGQDLSPPRRKEQSRDLSPHRRISLSLDQSVSKRRGAAAGVRPNSAGFDPWSKPPRPVDVQAKGSRIKDVEESHSDPAGLSPPRIKANTMPFTEKPNPDAADKDLSGMRKRERMIDGTQAGLTSDKELAKELAHKKQDDAKRMKDMDPSLSGRGAETIYRDKRGKRLEGLEELLRQQQGDLKPPEKPLEWGKGLAQKREAELKQAEFEEEKNKPFARTRDDPELDKAFRERLRWGDPMAHLVKKKSDESMLVDLGASEEMKESGFIVPQEIPKHSWLKRGVAPPANRYDIKPGRHWDGVDRSTGFEKEMFKSRNEKQALEREAYLWSVSDM